jgi:hypothetical protein
MATRGERGPKGDHGQQGEHGETGITGRQGEKGVGFSRTQVAVMFLFVVLAFMVLALRTEHNAGRIDVLEHQVACQNAPSRC